MEFFKKTYTNFEAIKGMADLVAKPSQDRTHLKYIYNDGTYLMATNGHAAIRTRIEPDSVLSDAPQGYFKVVKRNKTVVEMHHVPCDNAYPDMEGLFNSSLHIERGSISEIFGRCGSWISDHAKATRFADRELCFNPEMFRDLYQAVEGGEIRVLTKSRPVLFVGGRDSGVEALLMPAKM
jgi:hypothetical protein